MDFFLQKKAGKWDREKTLYFMRETSIKWRDKCKLHFETSPCGKLKKALTSSTIGLCQQRVVAHSVKGKYYTGMTQVRPLVSTLDSIDSHCTATWREKVRMTTTVRTLYLVVDYHPPSAQNLVDAPTDFHK